MFTLVLTRDLVSHREKKVIGHEHNISVDICDMNIANRELLIHLDSKCH